MFAKLQRIHFVGIGGIGMSGIAEVLINLGYKVSGSDLKHSAVTERLEALGATVFEGHRAGNITGAEVVVTSSAIDKKNPEVLEAQANHIPVIPRAEMLAELMRLKYGIAVAGMHGKTTTTSMVAAVLAGGELDPTVIVGGRVDAMGSNARLGKSQYMVAEADESDRSFLKLWFIHAVVTNLDREHMDCYHDMEDIEQTFVAFMDSVPFYGMVVACNDNEPLRNILARVRRRIVTYGTNEGSDFLIRCEPCDAQQLALGFYSSFSVEYRAKSLGNFVLRVPGIHNVRNATAAIAIGLALDIPLDKIRTALAEFRGVDRRFQLKGKANDVSVIDDYGHHPTEIRATLAAAKQCGFRHIHVVFQPHRYTRTRDLMDEFAASFDDADSLYLLDIYPASEQPIPGVTTEALARKITERSGRSTFYAKSFQVAAIMAATAAQPGDMILTLGAGNVSQLGPQILERLSAKTVSTPE